MGLVSHAPNLSTDNIELFSYTTLPKKHTNDGTSNLPNRILPFQPVCGRRFASKAWGMPEDAPPVGFDGATLYFRV